MDAKEQEGSGKWLRFNLDSGAAISAFPKSFKPPGASGGNGRSYKTASGQHIKDEGAVRLKAQDESGNMRGLKGRLTDVHKPLVSASESAKAGQNSWLTKGGGYMVPQTSGVSKKIEKMIDNESRKKYNKLLPVYEEGGVYNFYLKMNKDSSIAPLEEKPEKLEDLNKDQLIKMIQELKKGSQGFHRPQ